METKEVTQKGNLLQAKVTATNPSYVFYTVESSEFVISGVVVFQLRLVATSYIDNSRNRVHNIFVFVRFAKRNDDADNLTYMMYLNSVELKLVDKMFTIDDGTWRLIHEDKRYDCDCCEFDFDVAVELRLQQSASSFARLHEDTELTDFELCGEGGSVRVHRAVLAAASPVLHRMLSGEWRETAEGYVNVTGTSKATLEHLKRYMYLHELPESGLEQLLLLSSYYIMPELEQLCVDRLVRGVSEKNALDLIRFAAKNNLTQLLLSVLECVQNSTISVKKIRDHIGESK